MPPSPGTCHLLGWRPLRRNSLLGFASVGFPSGVIIHEIGIHASRGRPWAAPPSRPWLKGNAVVLDRDGRVKWQPLIQFVDRYTRDRWSAAVIAALEAVR